MFLHEGPFLAKKYLPDPVWPCIRVCISGGTVFGKGGPILAAKISPGRPILATKIGLGNHFFCKNWSGGTDFGVTAQSGMGGPRG